MEHPHRTPGLGQTQQAVGQRTAKEGLTVAACSVSKVAWLVCYSCWSTYTRSWLTCKSDVSTTEPV